MRLWRNMRDGPGCPALLPALTLRALLLCVLLSLPKPGSMPAVPIDVLLALLTVRATRSYLATGRKQRAAGR